MELFETISKPFLKKKKALDIDKTSSVVHPDNVITQLDGEELASSWFNGDSAVTNIFNSALLDKNVILANQAVKIDTYRKLAFHNSEIKNCINEIVNEIVGGYTSGNPIAIEFSGENNQIGKVLSEVFDEMCTLFNIKSNLYKIIEQAYTDGQLICHLSYNTDTQKNGIKSAEIIDPRYFYYDRKKDVYRYNRDVHMSRMYISNQAEHPKLEFSREEIVRMDFGLYEDDLCLSYLEFAVKNANILQNLEDLLVPLRFSRSISRRVFNVDVGNLPPKRVEEVMKQVQAKFKYKKFYNQETGEISNQQHITSMVEDYWFPNRSGGKGTSVDVLDESGNLGELSDIIYYVKKLYRSMNVPISRSQLDELDNSFDFESTTTSKEDIKFFTFISSLRDVFSKFFLDILKRQLIAKNLMTEKEFDQISGDIKVVFVNQNHFIEKMRLANLREKMDVFVTVQEQVGKLFSVNYILKSVLGMTDEEIDRMFTEISEEETDPKFKKFYDKGDDY